MRNKLIDNPLIYCLIIIFFWYDYQTFCQSEAGRKIENQPVLELGYSLNTFQDVNVKDALASTRVFADMMVKRKGLDIKTKTEVYDNLQAIEKDLHDNKLDLVVLLPCEYLDLSRKVQTEPLFVSVADGKITDEYLLLVNKESGILKLSELRGKKIIAEMGGKGMVIYMWLDLLLYKENLPSYKDFFSLMKEANKASQTVLPVFFNQYDACIVSKRAFETMCELNPQVADKLAILKTSPGFLRTILCMNISLKESELKSVIEESLLGLQNEPTGRQVLTLFQVDKLAPFKASYLSSIEELQKEYEFLKSKKTLKKHSQQNTK